MARQARIVIPETPHHIMQRGLNNDPVFFSKEDFKTYLDFLGQCCNSYSVSLISYCLLRNQIHMIAAPDHENGLARAMGEAHRLYTRYIHEKYERSGPLFQNRFYSYPMDEGATITTRRYIETLPLTLQITDKPENYLWSSARCRIKKTDNPYLKPDRSFHGQHQWANHLDRGVEPDEVAQINTHLKTGRPCGGDNFLDRIEQKIGRSVRAQKRGRKPLSQKTA